MGSRSKVSVGTPWDQTPNPGKLSFLFIPPPILNSFRFAPLSKAAPETEKEEEKEEEEETKENEPDLILFPPSLLLLLYWDL